MTPAALRELANQDTYYHLTLEDEVMLEYAATRLERLEAALKNIMNAPLFDSLAMRQIARTALEANDET